MAQIQDEYTTSFDLGMDDGSAATRFPQNAVRLIVNGRIEPDGSISPRPGSRRKHATSLNTGTGFGGTSFVAADGTEQLLVFVGDKAFVSSGAVNDSWTEIATGLRLDYWSFATMRVGSTNWLFAANGSTNIYRWNGTTWSTLPNAPEGVKHLAVYNGRLWASGHNGIVVQASRIANPETWAIPDGLFLQVINHGEVEITGLYQLGSHLLVFSRQSTSYIDGFGEQTLIIATGATGFSRSVGCVAFRTIAGAGDNAACWLSERGIEYYASGGGIRLVSRRIQKFLRTADRIQFKEVPGIPSAVYDPVTVQYHLALSTTGARNDKTVVVNLLQDPLVGQGGLKAATSIDEQAGGEGTILLDGDPDGYLTDSPAGSQVRLGLLGYMTLAGDGEAGDSLSEDDDGYLTSVIDNTLPSTLFMAPNIGSGVSTVIHSVGYDGFVRKHFDSDMDDADLNGDGGSDVAMRVVSRPFLFGRPRHRKRVRVAHVATINEEPVDLILRVRVGGRVQSEKTMTIPSTNFDQPQRRRSMMAGIGDQPQLEIITTDKPRIALVGLSAEILREPV